MSPLPRAAPPCRTQGPDALADPGVQMPGRYLHLSAQDMRLRDVPDVLADYQLLYASHASLADAGPAGGAAAGAGGGSGDATRPATPV